MTPARLLSPLIEARTWLVTGYLLLSLLTGTAWFILLALGVTFGLGFLLVWVGAALLAVLPVVWRFGARLERRLVGACLGVQVRPPYRPTSRLPLFRRAQVLTTDPATWKDLVYLLLLFPIGIVWSTLVAVFWGWGLTLLTVPLYYSALADGRIGWLGLADLVPPLTSLPEALLACLAGVVLVVAAPHVVRGAGQTHGWLACLLLGASREQELAVETQRLRTSRDRGAEAAAAERRRIERDLHDGAQQRLVSVAMNMGLALQKLDTDPGRARTLLEGAHTDTKRAIAELRELARGIHPAMLADEGLDGALSALVARCPVPVETTVADEPRPPEVVEQAAYYVLAETLTNVAKHAGARRAWILVERRGEWLRVEVRDDGVGGARVDEGGGLAGLADRVAGLDGRLDVSSPAGGPTTITVELPCAS